MDVVRLFLLKIVTFCGLISVLVGARADAQAPNESRWSAAEIEFFEAKIRPVLLDRCVECHSHDVAESGLSVESRAGVLQGGELGPAVVPQHPEQSLLISAINHGEFIKMPPKDKLSTAEVLDFTRWVKMGAPWPNDVEATDPPPRPAEQGDAYTSAQRNFWSLQPLDVPSLPDVSRKEWGQSPIDRFVLAKLEHAGLEPAVAATKFDWIRRATYDLTGLPPQRAEIDQFLADRSPTCYERVVDRLLASPRYGERWGRHWLDVARYADSNGLDENLAYAHAYRYRDYVIAALNSDKPYDRFIAEQVAGDLLYDALEGKAREDLQLYVATGFLAVGSKMLAEDDPVKMQMDIIDEQLHTLGQAVLGLTLGCARCHDHKFDPIPIRDYYSLAGIFKSTKTMNHHRVVAEWYERPLIDQDAVRKLAQLNDEIDDKTAAVNRLRDQARERGVEQSRQRFGSYLRAALALERFDQRLQGSVQSSVPTDGRFPLDDGFVMIEAESFQRGDVARLDDGYGEGIGVIASRGAGFVEYDLEVSRAGTYDLELRYTAEQSRPFQVIVNGQLAASDVGGQVTGSWYPPGQTWFAAARLDLAAGPNVLRFTSDAVYPHVDKFALIFVAEDDWPFDTTRPESLSRISAKYAVPARFARRWHQFLHLIADEKVRDQSLLLPWARLLKTTSDNEVSVLRELFANATLKDAVFEQLRRVFDGQAPASVAEFADFYQRLADDVFAAPKDDVPQSDAAYAMLRKIAQTEFKVEQSPLLGAKQQLDEFLQRDERREVYNLNREIAELEASKPKPLVAMGVTEGDPQDLRIHLRGSHLTLGSVAPRGFLSALPVQLEMPQLTSQSGRLELAQWLTAQPLTNRVIVNRLWHWHFGTGIVASVDNFGALGELPSHPMLLDWLAGKLMRSRGSLKALHREMMLSSTYRMSTRYDPRGAAVDPDNRLLWRMSRRRLTAEEVRDAILTHGGGLDLSMGGSLLKVANRAYVTSTGTNVTVEYQNRRRTVYLPVVRSAVYDVLQTLDFPDPSVSVGKRQVSTVAPQALMLMNSELVEEETMRCAERICANATSEVDRIQFAYTILFGKDATSVEVSRAQAFLRATRDVTMTDQEQAWRSFVRVLMSTNAYAYLE